MQVNLHDLNAPKKSANLSINSVLLRQIKSCRINLSKVLEQRLAEMLLEKNAVNGRRQIMTPLRHTTEELKPAAFSAMV